MSKPTSPSYKTTNWAEYNEAPRVADNPLAGSRLLAIAIRLVRFRDELGCYAFRQKGQIADIQRRRDLDLSDHDSAVRDGALSDRAM